MKERFARQLLQRYPNLDVETAIQTLRAQGLLNDADQNPDANDLIGIAIAGMAREQSGGGKVAPSSNSRVVAPPSSDTSLTGPTPTPTPTPTPGSQGYDPVAGRQRSPVVTPTPGSQVATPASSEASPVEPTSPPTEQNMYAPPSGWWSFVDENGQTNWRGPNNEVYNTETGVLLHPSGDIQIIPLGEFRKLYPEGGRSLGGASAVATPPTTAGAGQPSGTALAGTAAAAAAAPTQPGAATSSGIPKTEVKPKDIRSLRDILSKVAPGSSSLNQFSGTELASYLPVGVNDPLAAGNLLRTMGYEPNQSNPNVGALQALIPQLSRQSDIQRRLGGAVSLNNPALDAQKGQEARLNVLGDVNNTMASGATSRFTPSEGMDLLKQLNERLQPGQKETPAGLMTQFGGVVPGTQSSTPSVAAEAWQVVADMVGGGMSPYLMGSTSLQQRTLNRMWEDYQNEGSQAGSFLDYLIKALGAGGQQQAAPVAAGAP